MRLNKEEKEKMLEVITDYILFSHQRLEDFADIEICCQYDLDLALGKMYSKINKMPNYKILSFYEAIRTNTVNYIEHGCR